MRFPEVMSENPKKPFLRSFLAQNLLFFQIKLSILLFAHLLHFNRRLPCKFELNWINTASLRSVSLKLCRKTPKNPFLRSFLAQNLLFFQIKWSFSFFAHLIQQNRRIPCKLELNRSNTLILRSVSLK